MDLLQYCNRQEKPAVVETTTNETTREVTREQAHSLATKRAPEFDGIPGLFPVVEVSTLLAHINSISFQQLLDSPVAQPS